MRAKASFPSETSVELVVISESEEDTDRLSRACEWLQAATGCISRAAFRPSAGEKTVSITLTLHPLAQDGKDIDIPMEVETEDRYRIGKFVEFFPSFVLYDAVASKEGEASALILQFVHSN
ncbi:MAG: hypothetical protein Q7S16_00350 [bacterium]|nr:hypothetical protein [bacterium]